MIDSSDKCILVMVLAFIALMAIGIMTDGMVREAEARQPKCECEADK